MISMKSALAASLVLAPFALTSAYASSPDEFTLEPMGVGSTSTVIYSPETYTTGTTTTTIATQPAITSGGNGQFEDVNINDYLVPETNTNTQ